jgi:hypothetical protein
MDLQLKTRPPSHRRQRRHRQGHRAHVGAGGRRRRDLLAPQGCAGSHGGRDREGDRARDLSLGEQAAAKLKQAGAAARFVHLDLGDQAESPLSRSLILRVGDGIIFNNLLEKNSSMIEYHGTLTGFVGQKCRSPQEKETAINA